MKLTTRLLILYLVISVKLRGQADTSEYSFSKVYTQVFSAYCALPACHDGSFEPDFRTIESSYYTLVNQPIIKNNLNKTYAYRVVPKSSSSSVLYQRITNCCFVNTNDRMPLTILKNGDTLPGSEIELIKMWIEGGAKDICGNAPSNLLAPISIQFDYFSYSNGTVCISALDNRVEKLAYKPFIIKKNVPAIKLEFSLSTQEKERLNLLSNPVLKISDSLNDFSKARILGLKLNDSRLEIELRPNDFRKGRIYYMEVEVMDKKVSRLVKYPDVDTDEYKKLNWSFVIMD